MFIISRKNWTHRYFSSRMQFWTLRFPQIFICSHPSGFTILKFQLNRVLVTSTCPFRILIGPHLAKFHGSWNLVCHSSGFNRISILPCSYVIFDRWEERDSAILRWQTKHITLCRSKTTQWSKEFELNMSYRGIHCQVNVYIRTERRKESIEKSTCYVLVTIVNDIVVITRHCS